MHIENVSFHATFVRKPPKAHVTLKLGIDAALVIDVSFEIGLTVVAFVRFAAPVRTFDRVG